MAGPANDRTLLVSARLATDIVEIAAGSSHTCAISASGAFQCWGWNADGRLGDGTFSGRDGPVDVVGFGLKPPTPTPTPNPTERPRTGDANCDGVVSAVDAMLVLQRSAALIPTLPCASLADADANGAIDGSVTSTVVCWGDNSSGQLGNGGTEDSTRPITACETLLCQPLSNGLLASSRFGPHLRAQHV